MTGPLENLAQMDQASAQLASLGDVLAAYYLALIARGVDKQTAGRLLRDYQWMLIHSSLWPGKEPQTGPE